MSLFDENDQWYKNEINEVLKLIKKNNTIIEINTRGQYKGGVDIYPNPSVLSTIKKMGIPVSINSDSHKPDELIKGYKYAAEVLKNHGIDEIWSLIDGKWQPFKFDPVKGIDL
jgi:histidinol-phosphatase (PHP family)